MIDFDIRKRFRPKTGNKVGLDIGAHSVKMVEVSGTSEKPSLVSFGVKKILGSGADAATEAVKALAGELKISVRDLNISLSGPSIVSRVISMPDMTSEELKNAVRFETEKSIPFDINDCTFDFYIQGKDPREKNNLIILLAAARRDPLMAKIKVVEDAGLGVSVIDVDSFAIANSFLKNYPSTESSKTIAMINIGEVFTNLIIQSNGMISFVRDLSHGVNNFRALVAKRCAVELDSQDAIKALTPEKAAEVAVSLRVAISGLLDDIKLSFGYHENQSGRGVDAIYLSGGGSGIVGLDTVFQEALGLKPEIWNPFQYLDIDPSKVNVDEIARTSSSFAVCTGLTLRSAT